MKCGRCRLQIPEGKALCAKKLGGCGFWNLAPTAVSSGTLVNLIDVPDETVARLCSGAWWAKLIGGGFVTGCVYLLGGEPGAGKSTFAAQVADACAGETGETVLYLPSEEKLTKIRGRFNRLQCAHIDRIRIPGEPITAELELLDGVGKHAFVICDSLTALAKNDPREAVAICNRLTGYAQATDTAVLIIDHVTKGEEFAGLMTLQHAVDTTMYFRADMKKKTRTMHSAKDRHGEGFVSLSLRMTPLGLVPMPELEESESEEGEGEEGT